VKGWQMVAFQEHGRVKVIHGPNNACFDGLAGVPVAAVKFALVDAFNVSAEAIAFVNGSVVTMDYPLQAGDVLDLIEAKGSKSALEPNELAFLQRLESKLDRLQEALALVRVKECYSADEVAAHVGRSAWVVRQWCNKGQVPGAYKIRIGRGKKGEWRIPHESMVRIQNEGPLPLAE